MYTRGDYATHETPYDIIINLEKDGERANGWMNLEHYESQTVIKLSTSHDTPKHIMTHRRPHDT